MATKKKNTKTKIRGAGRPKGVISTDQLLRSIDRAMTELQGTKSRIRKFEKQQRV